MNKETLLGFIFRRVQNNGLLRATLNRLGIEVLHIQHGEKTNAPTALSLRLGPRGLLEDS